MFHRAEQFVIDGRIRSIAPETARVMFPMGPKLRPRFSPELHQVSRATRSDFSNGRARCISAASTASALRRRPTPGPIRETMRIDALHLVSRGVSNPFRQTVPMTDLCSRREDVAPCLVGLGIEQRPTARKGLQLNIPVILMFVERRHGVFNPSGHRSMFFRQRIILRPDETFRFDSLWPQLIAPHPSELTNERED